MPDRREFLNAISDALLLQHGVIRSCDESEEHSLIMAARLLRDAVDYINVAATAHLDRRAAS
jgi:hypothetical protein